MGCSGHLGLARCQLPQTPMAGDNREKFEAWKVAASKHGLNIQERLLSVQRVIELEPAQKELDACKVCSMAFSSRQCIHGSHVPDATECDAAGCFCVWTS